MANESGILILGETSGGAILPITRELLGAARRMAGSQPVAVALIGSGIGGAAQEAIAAGADTVYVADDGSLAEYTGDAFTVALDKVVEQANPAVILMGQTDIGRDLAPRFAIHKGTMVSMDSIELAMSDSKLLATRPVYGGSARAVFSFKTMPQVATVRPKSQDPLEPDTSRQGNVVNVDVKVDASAVRTKVLEHKAMEQEGIRLEDADAVVTGGRGLGGPEGFSGLEELAKLLTGAVGASRAVCDLGWRPVSEQIGLTGKVVSPTLYVAVAVSGASQHMAGCSGAKNIVAINKDPEANIFKTARFGVVGDYKQVVPPLVEAVRKIKSEG